MNCTLKSRTFAHCFLKLMFKILERWDWKKQGTMNVSLQIQTLAQAPEGPAALSPLEGWGAHLCKPPCIPLHCCWTRSWRTSGSGPTRSAPVQQTSAQCFCKRPRAGKEKMVSSMPSSLGKQLGPPQEIRQHHRAWHNGAHRKEEFGHFIFPISFSFLKS